MLTFSETEEKAVEAVGGEHPGNFLKPLKKYGSSSEKVVDKTRLLVYSMNIPYEILIEAH